MTDTPTETTSLAIPAAAAPFIAAAQIAEVVTCRQMAVLHLIAANPDKSVNVLAATLDVHKPVVTRACDKLAKHGLVERKIDPVDLRKVRLRVTDAGSRVLGYTRSAA